MKLAKHRIMKLALAISFGMMAGAANAGFTTFEASISIAPTVDSFRSALGALNPNDGSHQASGRREINWDGVPDSFADPNAFPGDFFNSTTPGGRARGALFTTPGNGFLVSANAGGSTSTGFGFPTEFIPFSAQRLFTPVGSNVTEVLFFVPGTTTAGWVSGFGAVFSDVEFAGVTSIEFFDLVGASLFSRAVPTGGNGELSFLGMVADAGEKIGKVRITTGNGVLLANGSFSAGTTEGVVMDDFIYAEPQAVVPAPGTLALFAAGGLAWRKNKKRLSKA